MGGATTEREHTIVYRHSNGEVFEAENMEQAQKVCPVLGRLSLQEAGLLFDLEQMGKKLLEEQSELEDAEVLESDPFMVRQPDENMLLVQTAQEQPTLITEVIEPAAAENVDIVDTSVTLELSEDQPSKESSDSTDVDTVSESENVSDTYDTKAAHRDVPRKTQPTRRRSPLQTVTAKPNASATVVMAPEPAESEQTDLDPLTLVITTAQEAVTVAVSDTEAGSVQDRPSDDVEQFSESIKTGETPSEVTQPTIKRAVSLHPIVTATREAHVVVPDVSTRHQNTKKPEAKVLKQPKKAAHNTVAIPTKTPVKKHTPPLSRKVAIAPESIAMKPVHHERKALTDEPPHTIIERLVLAADLREPAIASNAHTLIETIIERAAVTPDSPVDRQIAIDESIADFIELGDVLGIEYSHQEIEHIIEKLYAQSNAENILDMPIQQDSSNALSDLGTHEGLAYFIKGSVALTSVGRTLHSALGQRALLNLAS